ncbi:cytochrome c-type biogenesis protein [Endozoicomonas sp. YOMI1]|uniref:cytochrome c-type biogenesis protein n=1 Tax=Endozoicomonas sp. YOMI1 TaxID=2828739 RepID=UPI00214780C5|nr:cytochrome c-type biogenesis protein [Endozoicomonas sp. YOMI1]
MIKRITSRLIIVLWTLLFMGTAYGVIDSYKFSTPEQEQRFFELTNELRCPKCQNQSIADSNAPIAQDLRREVHRLLNEGADNQAVIDFMLARYGDFVLYKPRISGVNLVLWLGPLLMLLAGLAVLVVVVRKHKATVSESAHVAPDGHNAEEELLDKKLNRFLTDYLSTHSSEDNKTDGKE